MAGKGDRPRPLTCSYEEYDLRWKLIYADKKDKPAIHKKLKELAAVRSRRGDEKKK